VGWKAQPAWSRPFVWTEPETGTVF
jgi:hypothetical protein